MAYVFGVSNFFKILNGSSTRRALLDEDSFLKKNLCINGCTNMDKLHLIVPESFFKEYSNLDPHFSPRLNALLTTNYRKTGAKGLCEDIAEKLSLEKNNKYLLEAYNKLSYYFSDNDLKTFTLDLTQLER